MAKKLSELAVGTLVKDTGTTYNGKPIIFQIMEHGHSGDPSGSTALITEKIITLKSFDAIEASNSDSNRKQYGNNRWLYSNLRLWLNSDATAGKWYTAQHSADAAPTNANVWSNYNEYDQEAGFLSNFSANMKAALLTNTKRVAKNTVTDGGGYEDTTQKIFLLSNTEVGLANENSIAEGSIYALFNTASNRQCKPTAEAVSNSEYTNSSLSANNNWYWWLRTPCASYSYFARCVSTDGSLGNYYACTGYPGVRPACTVLSSISVSDSPDESGVYTIMWNSAPEVITDSESLGDKNTPFDIQYQITDADGDVVNATVKLDDTTVATHEPVDKSVRYTYSITGEILNELSIGSHKLTITATDEPGETTTKEITFNKVASSITISGEDTELGEKWMQPSYSYSVSDNAGHSITVTELIDDENVRTIENAEASGEISFSFGGFNELSNEENHTACIKAENTDGAVVYRYISFRKLADRLEFETKPVETDALAEKIVVSVKYDTTGDPDLKVEVTNAACSDVQIWEDATEAVKNKNAHIFQNKTFDNGKYGIAVRITIMKNENTSRVHCYGLGICFD